MAVEGASDLPGRTSTGHAREYRVAWDRKRSRYQVVRDDGLSFGFSGHREALSALPCVPPSKMPKAESEPPFSSSRKTGRSLSNGLRYETNHAAS
jgi:hypothetical protein